jgi:hypothetical protein
LEALRKYVEDFIGIPLSLVIPKDIKLYPLDQEDPDKAYSFISKEAKGKIHWLQSHIGNFLQNAPIGYFLFGHMGHGVNSYAIHLASVDAWSKVFFRLGIGGAYMDNDAEAKRIRKFLPKFFDFKKRIRDKTKLLIAIDSHWSGDYRILLNNGNALELEETLLANPNFDLIFEKGKRIDAKNILL